MLFGKEKPTNFALNERIATLRRQANLTQEQLAERLGISAQAVSKWETGQTCPDVATLPDLAGIFGVSMDDLFGSEPRDRVRMMDEREKAAQKDLMLRMRVNTNAGDRVNINLPVALIRHAMAIGMKLPEVNASLQGIEMEDILRLVESGLVGKVLDVQTARGDIVEIVVE